MLQLIRSRHVVIRAGTISGWLEREFPDRDLFVYYHTAHDSFNICEWVNKDRGLCEELMVIDQSLGNFTRPMAEELRFLLRVHPKQRADDAMRGVNEAHADLDRQYEDDIGEERAFHRWARHGGIRSHVKRDTPLLRALANEDTTV